MLFLLQPKVSNDENDEDLKTDSTTKMLSPVEDRKTSSTPKPVRKFKFIISFFT